MFEIDGIKLQENPDILIDWFDDFAGYNPYAFLSNFYEGSPFTWKSDIWKTSEHAYQAMKASNVKDFNMIRDSQTPDEAKYLGRSIKVRDDWEEIKFQVMHDIVLTKFIAHADLGQKLIDTGNAYLQEGTFWNDQVWGVDLYASDNPNRPMTRKGDNWLGIILMDVRSRLNFWKKFYGVSSVTNGQTWERG